jgi:hypothetical protein
MCTYATEQVSLTARARTERGWQPAARATVYFDHPVHAPLEHSVNIDFVDEQAGPSQRVAVELSPASARALVACIQAALAAAGPLADEAAGTD